MLTKTGKRLHQPLGGKFFEYLIQLPTLRMHCSHLHECNGSKKYVNLTSDGRDIARMPKSICQYCK